MRFHVTVCVIAGQAKQSWFSIREITSVVRRSGLQIQAIAMVHEYSNIASRAELALLVLALATRRDRYRRENSIRT